MKQHLIIFLLLIRASCEAQLPKGHWISEKYVLALVQKDTTDIVRYIEPIIGFFIVSQADVRVVANRSELMPIKTKKLIVEGKIKFQLFNFQYYVNTNYSSKETLEKYKTAKLYLSKVGVKLLLEIYEDEKVEKIYFVDRFEKYRFRYIREVIAHLKTL